MTRRDFLVGAAAVGGIAALFGRKAFELPPASGIARAESAEMIRVYSTDRKGYVMIEKITKSDAEWRRQLSPEQFEVTRKKGTERAYTGATWDNHAKGVYRCVCCGNDLYGSDAKYESGTGWPSFWMPIAAENIRKLGQPVPDSYFASEPYRSFPQQTQR